MASVNSPTDASSTYYKDLLKSTEDHLEEQNKTRAQADKEYRASSEAKIEDTRLSQEEELNQTVDKMRDYYDRQLADSREENRTDRRNQTEATTYDRRGRIQEKEKEIKELKKQFEASQQQLENQLKQERQHADKRIEVFTQNYADKNSRELEKATEAHNLSRENMRQMMQDDIRALKRVIATEPNVKNSQLLSPQVEDRFKQQVASQYQQNFEAQENANKGNYQNLREAYSDRLQQSQDQALTQKQEITNRNALDTHQLRSEFMEHSFEIQKDKEDTLHRKEREHMRSSESQQKAHTRTLQMTQRDGVENIENTRRDAALALESLRSKASYDARVKDREHAKQIDTLKRNFDKQLGSTKEQYEQQIADMKHQHGQEIRNKDREFKRELDNQALGIAERQTLNETSQKERERLIHENYHDQIERMKRNYELNNKKKG